MFNTSHLQLRVLYYDMGHICMHIKLQINLRDKRIQSMHNVQIQFIDVHICLGPRVAVALPFKAFKPCKALYVNVIQYIVSSIWSIIQRIYICKVKFAPSIGGVNSVGIQKLTNDHNHSVFSCIHRYCNRSTTGRVGESDISHLGLSVRIFI